MSEQLPYPGVSQEPADGSVRPVRRSRSAVAALVLGVLAIPLSLAVYPGALAGVLAILLGTIGVLRTRAGRATGRGMAVAGLVIGLVGLVLALSLGVYGMRTYRDCETKLGHPPSRNELRECVRSGL